MSSTRWALERTIGALVEREIIHFEWCSKWRNLVEMTITSNVFTEPTFIISVPKDEWEDGPKHAVAKELTELVLDRSIELVEPLEWYDDPANLE